MHFSTYKAKSVILVNIQDSFLSLVWSFDISLSTGYPDEHEQYNAGS